MKNLPNYEKALKAIEKEKKKLIDVDTVYNNRVRHCELYKQARNADDETKNAILAQIHKEDADEKNARLNNNFVWAVIACLKQNAKIVLFNELMPAIIEYLKGINGKQYGEKTAEKLRQYFKDNYGVSVSVYRRYSPEIDIYVLDANGYSYGGADLVISPRVYSETSIINAGRINMDNLNSVNDFYLIGAGNDIIVNPGARVRELRKLKTRAIKELNALTATISAFNHSKPETLPDLPFPSINIYGDII